MAYEAVVLADSTTQYGERLTTIKVTLPRMVLAEFNTHRDFSRNSASSRAIPLDKQLERLQNDPAMPIFWGANRAGMQAVEELLGTERNQAIDLWFEARDKMIDIARRMGSVGLHKQVSNRLLEPFMWQTIIATSTNWRNFFALRDNPDAQPELWFAAHLMRLARDESRPTRLKKDEWHLPLLQPHEKEWAKANPDLAVKVCVGRCARVSYLTHDGKRNPDKDIELYERLLKGGHMSPFEHIARPKTLAERIFMRGRSNFRGWYQHRKEIPNEHDFSKAGKAES